jgi:FixJ family two-component response regulator
MPGLDGNDVISALRVLHADVPVIAISGGGAVAKDELLAKAASLGAVEVIMKPFEFRQLAGAVTRALSR